MPKKDNKGLLIVLGILAVILIFMFGNFQTGSLVSVEPSTIDGYDLVELASISNADICYRSDFFEVGSVSIACFPSDSSDFVDDLLLGLTVEEDGCSVLKESLLRNCTEMIGGGNNRGLELDSTYKGVPIFHNLRDIFIDGNCQVSTSSDTYNFCSFNDQINIVSPTLGTVYAYIDFYFEEDEPENTTTQVTCWHIVGNDCTSYTATKEAGETNTQACSPGYINQLSCEGALPTSECPAFISKIGEPVINADMGFSNPCKAGWTVIGVIIGLIILFMLMKGGK